MRSLRDRLMIVIAVVLVIPVIVSGLLFSRIASVQFERFLAFSNADDNAPAVELARAYGRQHGSWRDVERVLDGYARSTHRITVLVEADGTIHAPHDGPLAGASLRVTPDGSLEVRRRLRTPAGELESLIMLRAAMIPSGSAGRAPAAMVLVAPSHPERTLSTARSEFLGGMNRGLMIAIVAAAILAALVALGLARRVLGPIEELTGAARRMEAGDRAARVDIRSGDEIGELAHAFNAMADSVARTERLRRDLVNDVAHELRTPLTNLRCQIEALQDGLAAPDAAMLASLHEEALLLGRLVEDLQQLALAEAGGLRLELAPLDLGAVIARTRAALEAQAAQTGVTLESRVADGLPPALADGERVGQILRNLADNALRHTPRGGRIEITAQRVEEQVEIAVRDDGPGIAPEHLPHVFERFYRTDASRARATGGAGLGLAIVRQLVQAQGGEVRVESVPGQGATFRFTLPIAFMKSS